MYLLIRVVRLIPEAENIVLDCSGVLDWVGLTAACNMGPCVVQEAARISGQASPSRPVKSNLGATKIFLRHNYRPTSTVHTRKAG